MVLSFPTCNESRGETWFDITLGQCSCAGVVSILTLCLAPSCPELCVALWSSCLDRITLRVCAVVLLTSFVRNSAGAEIGRASLSWDECIRRNFEVNRGRGFLCFFWRLCCWYCYDVFLFCLSSVCGSCACRSMILRVVLWWNLFAW